jgi:hypothetical protein
VICEQKNQDPNAIHQSEHHWLISIKLLAGVENEDDNGKVFEREESIKMHIAIYFSMVRPSLKRKVSEISCKALKIMQQPQLQPKEPSSNAYLMKQLCQCCGAFINNLTT